MNKILETVARYPEEKPTVLNYARVRADMLALADYAAALETAIRGCDDSDYATCQTCIFCTPNVLGCAHGVGCLVDESKHWEFDYARFSGGEGKNET